MDAGSLYVRGDRHKGGAKMKICGDGHQEVCFEGPICPVCELKNKVMATVENGKKIKKEAEA